MKVISLIGLILVLLLLCGCIHLSYQQDGSTRIEALDSVMKDTKSSLLQIANALVELDVSMQALKDAKVPDVAAIQLKKDHQQEMLQIQTTLQNQLNSYEAKAGYKSGSNSCASIASQLKSSMQEGQYWIYPVQSPMRVRCKLVGKEWKALSINGIASNPDVVVGPNANTGIYSTDGSNIGISVNGVNTLTTDAQGLKVNGKVDASHFSIKGQSLFTNFYNFENRFNFTNGEWFAIVGGTVTQNLIWGTYICRTSWHSMYDGFWLLDHSYLLSWQPNTNSHNNMSPFSIPTSTSAHEADTVNVEFRYRPRTGQVPPVLEMKIGFDYNYKANNGKRDGINVLFQTSCVLVLPH